jgi:acyl-homoserine lactone acylase PvdQ
MITWIKHWIVPAVVFISLACDSQAKAGDFWELLSRKAPENGPIETSVESWSVLAPGTGGLGAATCSMCTDQMHLYNDIVQAEEPYSVETLSTYYKQGNVGLHTASTYQLKPRCIFPDDDMAELLEAFRERGYDHPATYEPPNTLVATIDWDASHVPHVIGETVEDVAFGLGYATVYTNLFELLAIRYFGISGISQTGFDITSLFTSADSDQFESLEGFLDEYPPINFTRDELLDTMDPSVCDEMLGDECQELMGAMVAYQKGINNAMKARHPVFLIFDQLGIPWPEWKAIDTAAGGLAATSIFGDPGADQLYNLKEYRKIESAYGTEKAKAIFDDMKMRNAPLDETTVTVKDAFPGPVYADGSDQTDPDRPVDADSIAWLDLAEWGNNEARQSLMAHKKPHASNWMLISADKSASGHPILVGGPQMGYIRPSIYLEFDARTTDNQFQIAGLSIPGLFFAAFAGNAHNGVWSPTSAIGKTSDIFVEKLCAPDNDIYDADATMYYLHDGQCKPMNIREGNGVPFTVHGPVIAWDTVDGETVAISRQSYNIEHISQGIIPYYMLAKGKIKTAQEFIDAMQIHSLALNYAYINESEIAYINTGLYPVRAAGAQADLPIWGTGEWDWRGVITLDQRPHTIDPPEGFMLSWNNQSAPDFYQSDGDFQRVQILHRLISNQDLLDPSSLAQLAELSAVQDGYALTCLPLLQDYTAAMDESLQEALSGMMAELAAWVEDRQARRVDMDGNGAYDDAGPAIIDEIMTCLKHKLERSLYLSLGGFNFPNTAGSAYQDDTTGIVRMLLNRARDAEENGDYPDEYLMQCGDGTFAGCRNLVAAALLQAKANLTEAFDTDQSALWLKPADTLKLLPFSPKEGPAWHWQNRPTFQQVATVH